MSSTLDFAEKGTIVVLEKLNLDKPLLTKFNGIGIFPSAKLRIMEKYKNGSVIVAINNLRVAIDGMLAKCLTVTF